MAALARRPLRPDAVADGRRAGPQARHRHRAPAGGPGARGAAGRAHRPRDPGRGRARRRRLLRAMVVRPRRRRRPLACSPCPPPSWPSPPSRRCGRCCARSPGAPAPAGRRGGPVRELLAESLGDRSVSIAYWLPDRDAFVDEVGRPRGAARGRLGPRVDGRRAGRAPRRGDRARRVAGHEPRARPGRRGGVLAGDRQRAPEGRPARAPAGAARLAPADRRGDGRRAPAHRARPPRRRPAAARRAVAGAAAAAVAPEGPGRDPAARRHLRASRRRPGGAARARPRDPPGAADRARPRPGDSSLADRVAVPVDLRRPVWTSVRPRRSRRRPTSSSRRRSRTSPSTPRPSTAWSRCSARAPRSRSGRRRRGRRRRVPRAAACAASRTAVRGGRRAGHRQPAGRRDPPGGHDPQRGGHGDDRAPARHSRRCARETVLAARSWRWPPWPRVAACGSTTVTVANPRWSSPARRRRPAAPRRRRGRHRRVRIAVVTHGQASSAFWAIVRNGVEAAARQMDVVVDYPRPTSTPRAHEGAHRPGRRRATPTAWWSRSPSPAWRRRSGAPSAPGSRWSPSTPASRSSGAWASWPTSASPRPAPAISQGSDWRGRASPRPVRESAGRQPGPR